MQDLKGVWRSWQICRTKINGVVWKKRQKGECHCSIFVFSFILCSTFLFITMGEFFNFFCTWSFGGIIKHGFVCTFQRVVLHMCIHVEVLRRQYWQQQKGKTTVNHLVIKGTKCPLGPIFFQFYLQQLFRNSVSLSFQDSTFEYQAIVLYKEKLPHVNHLKRIYQKRFFKFFFPFWVLKKKLFP